MDLRLIVNADDYGHSPGVSRGIRKAHLEGIVTSTTAMMNMPGIEVALEEAMRLCPKLGLGVHLVASSGIPLLSGERVPSLTGGGERFQADQTGRIEQISLDELRDEWHAQVERFVQVTGHNPDHLDSHHHLSYFSEPIFRIMLEMADEFHCAVRSTLPARRSGETGGLPREVFLQAEHYVPKLLSEFQTRHPDHFEATFYGENATVDHLIEILSDLQEGCSELMCHPGYADELLLGTGGSSYNLAREGELAALTDYRCLELVETQGIHLISYAGIL